MVDQGKFHIGDEGLLEQSRYVDDVMLSTPMADLYSTSSLGLGVAADVKEEVLCKLRLTPPDLKTPYRSSTLQGCARNRFHPSREHF